MNKPDAPIEEFKKAMDEAVKGHPKRQFLLASLLSIAAVALMIAAGPSAILIRDNPDWFAWVPETLAEYIANLPTCMNSASVLLFGYSGKVAWDAVKSFISGKKEPRVLPPTEPIKPDAVKTRNTDGGTRTAIVMDDLRAKVNALEADNLDVRAKAQLWVEWGEYQQGEAERLRLLSGEDKTMLNWLAGQLLWRRLLLRGMMVTLAFAVGSMVASRVFPVEASAPAHGYALLAAFALIGAIACGALQGEKLAHASASQLVVTIMAAALICNICYVVTSYGYARMFTELNASSAFKIKSLGTAFGAAACRLAACPIAAGAGALLIAAFAGRLKTRTVIASMPSV